VAAHGWSQGTLPPYLTPEQEAADITRCVAALMAASGSAPTGWLSPRCTPSAATSGLLAAQGFHWHADMFDADLPYPIDTPSGVLVGVPFTMEVNDMPLYVRYGNEPDAFTRTLTKIVDGWPRLGGSPACRHHSPCACIRSAVWRAGIPGLPGRGQAQPALLADGSRAACRALAFHVAPAPAMSPADACLWKSLILALAMIALNLILQPKLGSHHASV
jgi:hypothetical protein